MRDKKIQVAPRISEKHYDMLLDIAEDNLGKPTTVAGILLERIIEKEHEKI